MENRGTNCLESARSFLIPSIMPRFLKGFTVLVKGTVLYLPGQLVRFIVRENDLKITLGETIDDFRKRKTLYSRTSI